MRKLILLTSFALLTLGGFAQGLEPEDWDGMPILPDFYSEKISSDGMQMIGGSVNGGVLYYNRSTGEAYYYADCTAGQGYVVADNGWIVGCQQVSMDDFSDLPIVMQKGNVFVPDPLKKYYTGDIHSITPDASRICGVLGNSGVGPMYFPFYCDIDASGNFSNPVFLPTPELDFYGAEPMYCSAKWMSEDGKTILGQVIQNRGLLYYPIVYRELSDGQWEYFLPSKNLFNGGEDVPEPLGPMEEVFPDAVYPEPTDYMDPSMIPDWEEAYNLWETNNFAEELDPYTHLSQFMNEDQKQAYLDDLYIYEMYQEEYNEMNEAYWEAMMNIADNSVFFGLNMMALSPNGEWAASSGEIYVEGSGDEGDINYIPYLFNLKTGDIKKIGIDGMDLITNQVTNDGTVICATLQSDPVPQRSYLYRPGPEKMMDVLEYLAEVDPDAEEWIVDHLTGSVAYAENEDGSLEYKDVTITGRVVASEDLSVITSGVDAYALNMDLELTYILTGLEAGIEEISADVDFNGVYTVFNIKGVKVMETQNASELNNLPGGIYIINGKKILKQN